MLKKIKYKKINDYCSDYFNELHKSFDSKAKNNLEKIIKFLKKNIKAKIIYLFVATVVLQQ